MKKKLHLIRRIGGDQNGATLLEFAFVAPVFSLMLMGALDIGYGLYIRSVASGTLESAARTGSLEGTTESQLRGQIRAQIYSILPNYARNASNVAISTRNYTDYSRINSAEKITVDNDTDGTLDIGDCWLDEDENGQYGTNEGKSGLGGADDGVYYTVTITLKALFPFYNMVGMPENKTFVVKTLVINQPYGQQRVPPTVCRTV